MLIAVPPTNVAQQARANQVYALLCHTSPIPPVATTVGSFFETLNADQCQQLRTILSNQMVSTDQSLPCEPNGTSHTTGTCLFVLSPSLISDRQWWIADSGASRHICANRSMFLHLHAIMNSSIMLHDNSCVSVQSSGDVPLRSTVILKDVLYVPSFKSNLLSISKLTRDSRLSISFFLDYFTLNDSSHTTMIGKGRRLDDLYVLHPKDMLDYVAPAYQNKVSLQIWRNRLGHMSDQRLAMLNKQLHCGDLRNKIHTSCYVCPRAKQRRLPFVLHNNAASDIFALVHCDIWGHIMLFHLLSFDIFSQ